MNPMERELFIEIFLRRHAGLVVKAVDGNVGILVVPTEDLARVTMVDQVN